MLRCQGDGKTFLDFIKFHGTCCAKQYRFKLSDFSLLLTKGRTLETAFPYASCAWKCYDDKYVQYCSRSLDSSTNTASFVFTACVSVCLWLLWIKRVNIWKCYRFLIIYGFFQFHYFFCSSFLSLWRKWRFTQTLYIFWLCFSFHALSLKSFFLILVPLPSECLTWASLCCDDGL